MTYRISEKDIKGQLDRLKRNTNNQIDFVIRPYSGYYHLEVDNTKRQSDISHGHTKSSLYWELVSINRVLELIPEHECNCEDIEREDRRHDLD